MWRSVLLHEFLDHRISNFQAVDGKLTSSSFALTPSADPASGINSVQITPGKGFEYLLAQPLQTVIGISCRVRLSYRTLFDEAGAFLPGIRFSVVRLGDLAELNLETNDLLLDPSAVMAYAGIRVNSQSVNLG